MLNKGLRDEKKVKIDNMLSVLLFLVLVPKFWNIEDINNIDNQLTDFGLTTKVLVALNQNDLIELLVGLGLDWNQQEQFADFLVVFSKENPFDLSEKAIAIYEYIQSESKTYSLEIFNKIASGKANKQ